jgi:predicted regulator of Ras-like GTPase activity (Roadblock/LC7/MglB family)
MESLPDLDRVSVAEKDALIRAQFAPIQVLVAEVAALTAKVAELEGRLALNSRN